MQFVDFFNKSKSYKCFLSTLLDPVKCVRAGIQGGSNDPPVWFITEESKTQWMLDFSNSFYFYNRLIIPTSPT